jgi:hypothetical protein
VDGGDYFLSLPAHHTRRRCNLAITSANRVYVLEDLGGEGCGAAVEASPDDHTKSRHQVARHGDLLVLVLTGAEQRMHPIPIEGQRMQGESRIHETLRLCGGASPACTAPIAIGEILVTTTSGGPPGADGIDYRVERRSVDWKLDGKQLILSRQTGELDDARTLLGSHRIRI